MVKAIATLLLALTAAIPSEGYNEVVKEPLNENQSIIVRVLPKRTLFTDGNYVLEGEREAESQTRYEEMKKKLDEKFARMFELKAELDAAQSQLSNKWDEYYTLHEKYNRELKRIISAWVTGEEYDGDGMPGRPVPLPLEMHRVPIEK